jgi:ABC-type oligopeptide transport system substrate-binding subunit
MNKAGFVLSTTALLLITACTNTSSNVSHTEVSAAPISMNTQPDKVTQVEPQESSSADTNQKLADKLNVIAKDSNNMMQEIASLRARLYLTPDLKEVYDISPAPKM